jgi:hypothetical protein
MPSEPLENSPLDAPLEPPIAVQPVCSPATMKRLRRLRGYLVPINSLLIFVFVFFDGYSSFDEALFTVMLVQTLVFGILGVVVLVGAVFSRSRIPYEARFSQLLLLYYCSVQLILAVLLVLLFVIRIF